MSDRSFASISGRFDKLWPGVALCAAVAAGAWIVAQLEERLFTYAVIEAVVLALLAGMLIRTRWVPTPRFAPGITFTAKPLLEFGIVLLGASLNLRLLQDAGWHLLLTILITTSAALGLGILLGRKAGLSTRLAILVAVGNAICGNSAIAATAPVIKAKKEEVAAALSLTALLGVGIVIALPAVKPLANLNYEQYGILAGLSVYAVPQVLAATFPVSALSGQIGTLVKLTRVLLLGPVVALFAILYRDQDDSARPGFSVRRYVPWFVTGFILTTLLRTIGIIPASIGGHLQDISKVLTIAAMAALGFGVDIRVVRQTGGRVAAVVLGLLLMLVAIGLALIKLFGL
ncbi:MAG: YeiH family putative sulfate export transporter [Thermomicrobiales bacterium]|nr:YeiH family putative sulfate export transporter [Thermomicrobiales bacterium]